VQATNQLQFILDPPRKDDLKQRLRIGIFVDRLGLLEHVRRYEERAFPSIARDGLAVAFSLPPATQHFARHLRAKRPAAGLQFDVPLLTCDCEAVDCWSLIFRIEHLASHVSWTLLKHPAESIYWRPSMAPLFFCFDNDDYYRAFDSLAEELDRVMLEPLPRAPTKRRTSVNH
jgi:hypothetical protein